MTKIPTAWDDIFPQPQDNIYNPGHPSYDPFFAGQKSTPPIKKEYDEMTAIPMVAKEGFVFGCDPEVFVFDPDGRPVPADMIPGTKENPYKVEHGAVQRDGFAAEFNIDPAGTFEEFNGNISAVYKQLAGFLPKGFSLQAVPSVVFDKDVFDAARDDVKALGCTPDFNAWTGEVNPPPADPDNPYMRCAAGHIHIGWTEGAGLDDMQHVMNCRDFVKQLDWYLGGWSLKMDDDPTRRALYGKAGACRFKPYGVEYRVLSNFWITNSQRRLAVWNRLQMAINYMAKGCLPDKIPHEYNNMLRQSIDTTIRNKNLEREFKYPLMTTDSSYRRGW